MSDSGSPGDWKVLTSTVFPKDLARVPGNIRQRVHDFVFNTLPGAGNPFALPNLDKLQAPGSFYKVRFGNYRLGLQIEKNEKRILVLRVMHRREIYRHFP